MPGAVRCMQKCVFVVLLSPRWRRRRHRTCRRSIGRCRRRPRRSTRPLAPRVDAEVAMATVRMMAPLWRLAGNPGVRAVAAVHLRPPRGRRPVAAVTRRLPTASTGWEQRTGTLRLGGPTGEVLLSRERHRVALAINSFSTPAGGASFRLVDAGAGTNAAAYEGKDVKGAVVLASGSLGRRLAAGRAQSRRGRRDLDRRRRLHAAGRDARRPAVGQHSRSTSRCKSFGFKATPRVAPAVARGAGQGRR